MKLAIFSTMFCAYETVLGVSNTAFLIAKQLIEEHDADVWVYAPIEPLGNQKQREDIFRMHISRFSTIGPKTFGIFRSGKIDEKFDIIHSYHYGYYPASAGFRLAKKNKLPHFLTTAYHPHQMGRLKKAMFSIYNSTEGNNILKNSSAVLPFNNNEMEQLKSIANATYIPTPSPINSDIFYPKKKKNKKITIGYVGNFLSWKGADIAMDICLQIEKEGYDVDFLFVGRGVLEEDMKKKATSRFTFMKDVSIKKLAECYNNIDIFVYPSFYESFGRVLAEAITCGSPVVSTCVGAIPETVGPGGLLVNYGDWKSMKDSVVKLVESKKLRTNLGKMGVKHAKKYDHRTVAENVLKIYNDYL